MLTTDPASFAGPPRRAPGRRAWRAACFALASALLLAGLARAQEPTWEFRVCADPDSLPFSHRNEQGFENRLAELLAAEMGATLTYDWSAFSPDIVDLRLRGGECDAIMGVPDEQAGLLTTIAYYRSPFVFATLASSGLEIESLDDPQLQSVRIGVQNYSIPPQEGLLNRGIVGVRGPTGTRPNPPERVLRELMAGEIDVGILWGPNADYFARTLDADFVLTPVTPEIDFPFMQMSLPMTIGVRARDYSLRDRLDLAIAARWDDIEALLDEYGVPLTPLPRPTSSIATEDAAEAVTVGVLLPMTTGRRSNPTSLYDLVGDAAYRGVELATADLNAAAGADRFRLLVSSTPNAAAAARAADRLLAVEGVDVLLGGLGAGEAEVLAPRAHAHGRLYLDLGSTTPLAAGTCAATTFFLEAALTDYLSAAVDAHAASGVNEWFVVLEAPALPPAGGAPASPLLAAAEAAIASSQGATLAGVATVTPGQPAYRLTGEAIRASGAEGVLVLIGVTDQLAFLGQVGDMGLDVTLAPIALPVMQTRNFLGATLDRVAVDSPQLRVVSFEPTRPAGAGVAAAASSGPDAAGAGAGSEGGAAAGPDAAGHAATAAARYASRYAAPMEASAFAGYQALMVLDELAKTAEEPGAWPALLAEPGFTAGGPKGPVRFVDGRLQQPLDIVALNPDAEWHNTLAAQLEVARYVGTWQPRPRDGGPASAQAPACAPGAEGP